MSSEGGRFQGMIDSVTMNTKAVAINPKVGGVFISNVQKAKIV